MDTEEDMDELEIATNDNGGYNRVLDWTTSDVVSVDNDISGVEPLEMTTNTDAKVRHWLRQELQESQYSFVCPPVCLVLVCPELRYLMSLSAHFVRRSLKYFVLFGDKMIS